MYHHPQTFASRDKCFAVNQKWRLENACWYAALRYLDPVVLGAFGYLSATITFTLSALLLKEKFTLLFSVSIVLSLGGMALMMLRPRPRPHP